MAWKRYKRLSYNPVTKRQEWFVVDEMTGQSGIETVEDFTNVLEDNKAMYAATDERAGWKGDWHRIANIPLTIAHDLQKKSSNFKDRKVMRKFINDSDNRFFLTRPVKL